MYLAWFDDTKNRPLAAKIDAAADAYERHFHRRPTLALISTIEVGEPTPAGITVESRPWIGRFNYWVGEEE